MCAGGPEPTLLSLPVRAVVAAVLLPPLPPLLLAALVLPVFLTILVVLRWKVVSVARRILASARVACSGHTLRGRGLARVVVALVGLLSGRLDSQPGVSG